MKQINWEYFYRWNPTEMAEGRIWQVFNMQGNSRTWYAGSSVGFESVRSVISYNNLLECGFFQINWQLKLTLGRYLQIFIWNGEKESPITLCRDIGSLKFAAV